MQSSTLRKGMAISAPLDVTIVWPAVGSAFAKLDPRSLVKNPVIFVLEIVTALTTIILVRDLLTGNGSIGFEFQIVLWLWFTVLFANFAEAIAEGRGKALADALHRQRTETPAKLLGAANTKDYKFVAGSSLKVGDIVLVEAGDYIPSDGEVIEGVASVNKAAITGESAPVIREAGGDHSAVTGGTQVLSDWIRVRTTTAPGSTFLDRMIKLVEGAERQRTPNEIALNILLAGLTIIFVFATATIPSYFAYPAVRPQSSSWWPCSSRSSPRPSGGCFRPSALPPGAARCQSAQHGGGSGASACRSAYRGPKPRSSRRAARRRAGAEPGP